MTLILYSVHFSFTMQQVGAIIKDLRYLSMKSENFIQIAFAEALLQF